MVFNFKEMTDQQLLRWFVMFLNGGDWGNPEDQALYEAACDEVDKRGESLQKDIAYLHSVL